MFALKTSTLYVSVVNIEDDLEGDKVLILGDPIESVSKKGNVDDDDKGSCLGLW
jgi:hypothetical protein